MIEPGFADQDPPPLGVALTTVYTPEGKRLIAGLQRVPVTIVTKERLPCFFEPGEFWTCETKDPGTALFTSIYRGDES